MPYQTKPGHGHANGATLDAEGVNFCIFSRHATAVELLLYEHADSTTPMQRIALDPLRNRSFFFWHVYVVELTAGAHYAWRIDGPGDTEQTGFRFDPGRELLDPWAAAVTDVLWDRKAACCPDAEPVPGMRSMVVDHAAYDWEGDQQLDLPSESLVIYELHVGGFTRHPSSGVEHPGTFAGVIEMIPYLESLGINAVELMPVMAFDTQDVPPEVAARGLHNYWGYSTHSFYSPHPGYCVNPLQGSHRDEFRDMVKALHRAGIAVILDVVFNHTAEGGADGPVMNFKGMGNEMFYHLDPEDRREYRDYTGCGNTVNCNHPLVTRFIVGCLEHWRCVMNVDGFRFDLASVLGRGEDGTPQYHAPVLWNIEFSDILSRSYLIAEAWDAAGLYQVGGFPGYRWAEWNGRYRDLMRAFLRGDPGLASEVATRIGGSSDMYQKEGRLPINSINFITAHDGFTLIDLFSYDRKHNEANGEGNRDGHDHNISWNCGVEGPSRNPRVLTLRRRQVRNALTLLLLSRGIPMLLAGDELLRSQRGNNNAYCQDNGLSWIDWDLARINADMVRFVREMIALRRRHPCLTSRQFFNGEKAPNGRLPDVTWHGTRLGHPPWNDPNARTLAFSLGGLPPDEDDLHVMMNMESIAQQFQLPLVPGRRWHRAVDTALLSPHDIVPPTQQAPVGNSRYRRYTVQAHSIVVLESRAG